MTPVDPTPSAAVAPVQNYEPEGVRFFDARSGRELLLVDDASPQYPGWLVYRHPDGQWVTLREATPDDRDRVSAVNAPAAVAPTVGETDAEQTITAAVQEIARLCDGGRWRMCVPVNAADSDMVFSDLVKLAREQRAALSSPVRAEPRQGPFMCDLHSPPLIFETADDAVRHFEATKHNYTLAPVRAERGEAERLRAALQEIADAEPALTGFLDRVETWDVFAHRLQEDALAALTPTPPATPTEPTEPTGDVLAVVATCERCHQRVTNPTTGRILARCPFCGGQMRATEGAWSMTGSTPTPTEPTDA